MIYNSAVNFAGLLLFAYLKPLDLVDCSAESSLEAVISFLELFTVKDLRPKNCIKHQIQKLVLQHKMFLTFLYQTSPQFIYYRVIANDNIYTYEIFEMFNILVAGCVIKNFKTMRFDNKKLTKDIYFFCNHWKIFLNNANLKKICVKLFLRFKVTVTYWQQERPPVLWPSHTFSSVSPLKKLL